MTGRLATYDKLYQKYSDTFAIPTITEFEGFLDLYTVPQRCRWATAFQPLVTKSIPSLTAYETISKSYSLRRHTGLIIKI